MCFYNLLDLVPKFALKMTIIVSTWQLKNLQIKDKGFFWFIQFKRKLRDMRKSCKKSSSKPFSREHSMRVCGPFVCVVSSRFRRNGCQRGSGLQGKCRQAVAAESRMVYRLIKSEKNSESEGLRSRRTEHLVQRRRVGRCFERVFGSWSWGWGAESWTNRRKSCRKICERSTDCRVFPKRCRRVSGSRR